jgi:hypothetical protein
MSGVGFQCAWCGKPLVDRDHATKHGPACDKSPVVAEVMRRTRYATLGEIQDICVRRALFAAPEAFRALQDLARHLAEIAGDLPVSGDLKSHADRATLPG